MASTKTQAIQAASEDRKETGLAGLPNTHKPGIKPRLSDEERQKRAASVLADHERLITARVKTVCGFLKDMGIASLAGRITSYDDVDPLFVEAALQEVEERVAACRAAIQARSSKAPTAAPLDLKARAAALAAKRAANTTPAA